MQSGISASKELVDQFNDLLSTPSTFGLLATITGESLTPLATLAPATGNFAADLALLQPHLKPDQALYVILRRHASAPALVAVSYVPDAAKVRQKMLFASTRLTLVRELGSEHFRETLFATAPEELSADGFAKHDRHEALAAPLTEEERTLGEVKRAEQEAGSGTRTREIHLSSHAAMPIADDVMMALRDVAAERRALVMLKINPSTETVELVPSTATPSDITELVQTISDTEPRFTIFRYAHSHGGGDHSPVLFLYTCPATQGSRSIKSRMLYPLMKRAVIAIAEGDEVGLTFAKRFEVEEPAEITEKGVLEELHPQVEVRQRFNRPKRPGR